jgi:signal transduction histidine kinase
MIAVEPMAERQAEKFQATGEKLSVLMVEDSIADAQLIRGELERGGFDLSSEVVQTAEEFGRRVRAHSFQVILADYNLPQWNGMEALDLLRREGLDIPLILVSGALPDVTAVDCIKQGAADYVLKDRLARLPSAIRGALQEKQLREERKHAERELAQKMEELARSNRELEHFAYVASHDLQEPLRMVATYTQLFAERYHGKLDAQAEKYIQYAVDGAKRMQTLIQDLLAFSRVGRQDTKLVPVDCNLILRQALQSLQVAIRESGAVLTYTCLPEVMANSSQLLQVFSNLLANAIKFRGPDKPKIHISAERQAGEFVFSVRDNGIGISPENAQDVFVIFRRLHTRTEYPGNGIGLAICRKIVEQHGGKIWVTPREDRGATFTFTLPVTEPVPAAPETLKQEYVHT